MDSTEDTQKPTTTTTGTNRHDAQGETSQHSSDSEGPNQDENEHDSEGNDNEDSKEKPENDKTTLSYLLHAASLHDSGRVAFLGSSSNMSLLLEPQGFDTYHFPLPEEITGTSSRLSDMDNEEIEILKFRGAFLLPPRDLCDDIVDAYFEKIHPTIPLINRTQFMRRYNDTLNPPSLLLLQAVLLAGSRVCRSPALLDSTGSSELASLTFYKRVKALYDANYESDRISIVQSLVLMGWWWEGPEDVTRNSFYWTRVALSVAQGFGLHRSVEKTSMPAVDKRIWKRIWWSLFLRDRWAAVALGRPVLINLEDSDVPMITEDDFIEDEPGSPSPYPVNRIHSLYFIHAVKLSEIMGFVLRQHFSVDAENMRRRNKVPSVSHCDMAMVSWMQNLPNELKYKVKDNANHNFFKALLHSQYYTILCLVHRTNIIHETNSKSPYPSWGIAFQAAHMIAKIMENMLDYDEPRDCPAFFVYTLFSAMIMLIYQTESPINTVVDSATKSLQVCFHALKEMGRTWLVGRMVFKLFQQLNENKSLRDHFVKSTRNIIGHRHKRKEPPVTSGNLKKRKTDSSSNTSKPTLSSNNNTQQSSKQNPTDGFPYTNKADWSMPDSNPSTVHLSSSAPPSKGIPSPISSMRTPSSNSPVIGNNKRTPPGSSTTLPSSSTSAPIHNKSTNAQQNPAAAGQPIGNPSSPDFAFVTNTPPQGSTFYENFQPSQLFPEQQDNGENGGEGSNIDENVRTSLSKDFLLGSTGSLSGFVYGQLNQPPLGNNGVPMASGQSASPSEYASSDYTKSSPGGDDPNNTSSDAFGFGPDVFGDLGLGFGTVSGSGLSRIGSFSNIGGLPGGASGGVPNSLNLGEWYNYLVSTVTVDGEQNGNTNSTNPATDGNTEKVPASNVETAEATTKGAKVENKTA